MEKTLDIAEALWKGETDSYTHHPFEMLNEIVKITDNVWFLKGFANTIVRETDDGLIVIDPGANFDRKIKFQTIRSVAKSRLNTAIYTHGHVDHIFGVPLYMEEAQSEGWDAPKIIAHEAIMERFATYEKTRMWKGYIDLRQFRGGRGEPFPTNTDFSLPTITYTNNLDIEIGGVAMEVRHSRGETDDHSWVFFPNSKTLCTGDLFIWGMPNAGNPQKVQRYVREWAAALREMSSRQPEFLLPGHGFPIMGADRVKNALDNTAAFLETLEKQTLALMNKGLAFEDLIHSIEVPVELSKQPYLQPIYDEIEFIVRNIWRLYGGWYDGTPSHLKPASEKIQGDEIAKLAGSPYNLVKRAEELLAAGGDDDLRLACHLADWAVAAAPDEEYIREITKKVYTARAKSERSTMAMGIFMARAREMGGDVEDWMEHSMVFESQRAVHGKKS